MADPLNLTKTDSQEAQSGEDARRSTGASAPCPSRERLEAFVRQKLSKSEFQAAVQHIEQCPQCLAIVKQLDESENKPGAAIREAVEKTIDSTDWLRDHVTIAATLGNLRRPLETLQVEQRLGDFFLIQFLGKGSFAKVFLARQESLQWLVALKVTTSQTDEAPTLARLDHEHIVRIHGLYVLPERQLLLVSMKYVPGGTLETVIEKCHADGQRPANGKAMIDVIDETLERRGQSPPTSSAFRRELASLPWDLAVFWLVAKVASALDHAHRRGVLHRDVKPANVLLTAEGSPMLADFNISFNAEVEGADPKAFFGGSLAYMSPEQLEATIPTHARQPGELDGRADIYSLGILTWELLTGTRPFEDTSIRENPIGAVQRMATARREGVSQSMLGKMSDTTSPLLTQTVLKCLEPDPQDRFQHAAELAGALRKQLVPGVQSLLFPPADGWRKFVIQQPLLTLVVMILLPNLLLTPIDILMNVRGIVNQLDAIQQEFFWNVLMPLVNLVLWPLPAIPLIVYALPILAGVRDVRDGKVLQPEQWNRRSRPTLRLGMYASLAVFPSWLIGGTAFSIGLDCGPAGREVDAHIYAEFIASQAMHGLLAALISFYLVTFVCVRVIYPRLIPFDPPSNNAANDLRLVKLAGGAYFGMLGIMPLLAVLALATLFWDSGAALRYVFVLLALLSAMGFLLAWVIRPKIDADLATLKVAVQPNEDFHPRGD